MFPLKWPKSIEQFFALSDQASNPGGEATLSVDCEMAGWKYFPSPFYAKAFVVAALPVLAVALFVLFWLIVHTVRNQSRVQERHMSLKQLKNRIVVSAVVVVSV